MLQINKIGILLTYYFSILVLIFRFESLKENVRKAVHESVDRLVDNFEEEFRSVMKDESPPGTPRQRDPFQFR